LHKLLIKEHCWVCFVFGFKLIAVRHHQMISSLITIANHCFLCVLYTLINGLPVDEDHVRVFGVMGKD
jgi:hypothetical protein